MSALHILHQLATLEVLRRSIEKQCRCSRARSLRMLTLVIDRQQRTSGAAFAVH